jgi:DNA-directed RNA polymerase specialized sigma24 family protein
MNVYTMQQFPNTHWSLVRRAGMGDDQARREALAVLLSRYESALRSYLRALWDLSDDQAEDLLQDFIADRILEHKLCRFADEKRGRFRALLMTSLKNFAIGRYRDQQRTPTVPLPEYELTDQRPGSPVIVEAAWARALIQTVIQAMHDECLTQDRADIWTVFEERLLATVLADDKVTGYDALAARLNLASPTQAANLLVTGKRMYTRLLREAVAEYEYNPTDVDGEIEELRRILMRSNGLESGDL